MQARDTYGLVAVRDEQKGYPDWPQKYHLDGPTGETCGLVAVGDEQKGYPDWPHGNQLCPSGEELYPQ